MISFKKSILALAFSQLLVTAEAQQHTIHPLTLQSVKVNDAFWSPKIHVWNTVTVYDVLDKLEGKYDPDRPDIKAEKERLGHTRDAFHNFDLVAQGKTNINQHDGPPW